MFDEQSQVLAQKFWTINLDIKLIFLRQNVGVECPNN